MINDSTPSDALLAEVRRDLRAVRPWPTPWRDALRLSPLAFGISVALPLLVGLRRDAVAVGPLVAWGVSLVQVALGIVLIWMATREGRPARRLPRGVMQATLAAAGFMVFAWRELREQTSDIGRVGGVVALAALAFVFYFAGRALLRL